MLVELSFAHELKDQRNVVVVVSDFWLLLATSYQNYCIFNIPRNTSMLVRVLLDSFLLDLTQYLGIYHHKELAPPFLG